MNPFIKIIAGTVVLVVGVVAGLNWLSKGSETDSVDVSQESNGDKASFSEVLSPLESISHIHGLAVDVADPNRLYIATHAGLAVLQDGNDLYRIGESQNDLMGFVAHPRKAKTFFASGHPPKGGSLGFQKSEDGGMSWDRVSAGATGVADFHALSISPVNPDLAYGLDAGRLQRSMDGGKKWEVLKANLPQIISLTACSQNEAMVYAATTEGLYMSTDKGSTWESISEDMKGTAVIAVAVSPNDSLKMFSSSQKFGLAKSEDGGKTWQKLDGVSNDEIVMNLTIDPNNVETVYTATRENNIFKSMNAGSTWSKIR